MIYKDLYTILACHSPEIETPAQGWRRAGDAIPGGVYKLNYRILNSACQHVFELMGPAR